MERVALAFVTTILCAGCAEEDAELEVHAPVRHELHCAELPHATPDDSFWLAQAIAEANRPPPTPIRQTVSLGYIGDEPLSSGVMRDTPMPARQYPDPFAQMAAPFTTDHYGSGYGRSYGSFRRWR
jgi:hypothetical protein